MRAGLMIGLVVVLGMEMSSAAQSPVTFDGNRTAAHVVGTVAPCEGVAERGTRIASDGYVDLGVVKAGGAFTVVAWVRSNSKHQDHPAILSNKDWNSGEIADFTTEHELGYSRTTGANSGWAIIAQPNGAWAWNLGNGRARLDYRPTAERQTISDGAWHQLAFSVDTKASEARLYYDGHNVAIYSLSGMGDVESELPTRIGADGLKQSVLSVDVDEVSIHSHVLTGSEIDVMYRELSPGLVQFEGSEHVDQLRVLAWNIWHGGRHNGREAGIDHVVEVIRESGADIICMQETYGSGPIIADRLGYYFYLRSSNLSVMSRYPIEGTFDLYQPFRFGGATVRLSEDQAINAFSLWIHYLPDFSQDAADGASEEELIAGEWETRASELRDILKEVSSILAHADDTPVVIAGDYNSASHLDWTQRTAAKHNGITVEWPVSSQAADAGLIDAYRTVHPNPLTHPGRTWSPRFTESIEDRIDYVYFKGSALVLEDAVMMDEHPVRWPSDHAAVLATFRLELPERDR